MKKFIIGTVLGLMLAGGAAAMAGSLDWLAYDNQGRIQELESQVLSMELNIQKLERSVRGLKYR